MTRKDYQAFADLFRTFGPEVNGAAVGVYTCPDLLQFCKDTAWLFANDNPRFSRDRYLAACGVKPEDRGRS